MSHSETTLTKDRVDLRMHITRLDTLSTWLPHKPETRKRRALNWLAHGYAQVAVALVGASVEKPDVVVKAWMKLPAI